MKATLELDGQAYEVHLLRKGDAWTVEVDGESFPVAPAPNGTGTVVTVAGKAHHVELRGRDARIDGRVAPFRILSVTGTPSSDGAATADRATHVRPPMNGKLERIAVAVGQTVAKGDVLFILEAMKMQNEVRSPSAGRVAALHLAAGATVEPRQVVLDLEPVVNP